MRAAGIIPLLLCVLSVPLAAQPPQKTIPASAQAGAKRIQIITLGDSITKGVRQGVTAEQTFAALLESALKKQGLNVEVVNVGIGGERTDQALKRLSKSVIERKPDIVTIMYGTNDSYVDRGKKESRLSAKVYRKNLEELVTRLRNEKIVPVLMTEPRWGENARKNGAGEHPNLRLERYAAVCRKVAKEMRVPLVDNYRVWTQQAQKFDIGEWTTDQCHPDPKGHQIIAKTMLPVLLRTIKQKK